MHVLSQSKEQEMVDRIEFLKEQVEELEEKITREINENMTCAPECQ